MSKSISRRSFLKNTAIGAAGLAGMSLMGSGAYAEEKPGIAWDAEYDVVVLGMGFAGCAAAIEAADHGAKVLISEKAPEGRQGGNSKASGQYIMSTDDKEAMYSYLYALVSGFPNYDDELLHTMVDGAYGNFDWLVKTLGADPKVLLQDEPWKASSFVDPVKVTAFDNREGYMQNWSEYDELPGAEHMLSILVSGGSFDASYYNLMLDNVAKRSDSIDVWFEAPGKHLIQDADGKIIGCKVAKEGKLLKIRARGGVVLATGGFENNNEMIANYMQRNNAYCWCAPYNDGDGVLMAQEVGAQLWHMSNAAGFNYAYMPKGGKTCKTAGSIVTKGILVGPSGARFMCEGTKSLHGRVNMGGSWIMTPMPSPTYFVCDHDIVSTTKIISTFSEGNLKEIENGELVCGATLEELAQKLGFDYETFKKHVDSYNDAYDNGRDADYGRPFSTMVPVKKGPFYALKLGGTMFNTQGGPRRNKYAQVVDVNMNAIPGLFSAGELGAMWPDLYNGGGNISEASVFGRIAGKNAALNARGEFEGAPYIDVDAKEAEAAAAEYAAKLAEAEAEAAAAASAEVVTYKDGVYTGLGSGYGGKIEITVTVEGGKITDIQYTHDETEAIGGVALAQLVEQAKAGKTEWADAVSGASLSTTGFEDALAEALAQAK